MSKIEENSVEEQNIESAIDQFGLDQVLWAIERICLAKADHLRSNWQDEKTAKLWEKDAALIAKTVLKIKS